jgi:methyltransferase (TIGR00027 family)
MRKRQTSFSALGIAIVRAIESARPESERICYDPYARAFVPDALYHFVRLFDRIGYSERKGPGVMGYLVARERHIDEHLLGCLLRDQHRIEQLVILGAGYDARAYRFPQLREQSARIFEVDHPATQAGKLARLRKIFGSVPGYVTYAGVDFNTQKLADRLPACGYSAQLTTLFVWQGVTQYLTPAAVDDTLAFVACYAPAGSSIIFDYTDPAILGGGGSHGEVRNMRRYRWLSGEQLVFGIKPHCIRTFLEERGFCEVTNADNQQLHELYFHGANVSRTVASGYAIVSATVAGGGC